MSTWRRFRLSQARAAHRANAALVVILLVGCAIASRGGGQEAVTQTKTGLVQKVDPATSTIVVLVTRELTFFIGAATTIEQNGAPRTVTDIHVGDTVTVTYSTDQDRNRIATQIVVDATAAIAATPAVGGEPGAQTKTGVVQKVDQVAGTIDVMVARVLTFTVNEATRILGQGQPRTLPDIQVGATVTVTYSTDQDRNRIATQIVVDATAAIAATPAVGGEPGAQTKTGVVQKVDQVAGTIDVMVARVLTFTVNEATRILGQGQPRTLADIQVGATVTVTYTFDPARNRTATLITFGASTPAGQPAAATGQDKQYGFTLQTKDAAGQPLQQKRIYWVYRPAGLSRAKAAPLIVFLGGGAPTMFHRKADEAGFLVVSCSFAGNSTGTPATVWLNDDPRVCGAEDYDYITEVIQRVRATENGGDAFTVGLSKNGHMSLAYACERPDMIRAAASIDEFMSLVTNRPQTPVPVLFFQGTADAAVSYNLVKNSVDAWRAVNGLMDAFRSPPSKRSPRRPGA